MRKCVSHVESGLGYARSPHHRIAPHHTRQTGPTYPVGAHDEVLRGIVRDGVLPRPDELLSGETAEEPEAGRRETLQAPGATGWCGGWCVYVCVGVQVDKRQVSRSSAVRARATGVQEPKDTLQMNTYWTSAMAALRRRARWLARGGRILRVSASLCGKATQARYQVCEADRAT